MNSKQMILKSAMPVLALALLCGTTTAVMAAAPRRSITQSNYLSAEGRPVKVWRADEPMMPPAPPRMTEDGVLEPSADEPSQGHTALVEDAAPASEPILKPSGNFSTASDCGCDQCGCRTCACDCRPFWVHRTSIFGDAMTLQATGINMPHALQRNSLGQIVGQDTIDPRFAVGYRVGFNVAISQCSSISATYTDFHSHTQDYSLAPPGGSVNSTVLAPGTPNVASPAALLAAGYDTDFQLFDFDYRRLMAGTDIGYWNATLGLRYGKLQQDFQQLGNFAAPTATIQTNSTVEFEGVGARGGIDGERRLWGSQVSAYGKSFLSVLFGRVDSNYQQLDATAASVQAANHWRNDRTVPILEYEVGLAWTSVNGHWRIATGYYSAYWFNMVSTSQYVHAVQSSNFASLGETVNFDGFVSRLEYRF